MPDTTTLSALAEINPRTVMPLDRLVSFVGMDDVSESFTLRRTHDRYSGELGSGYTRFREGDLLFAKITPCMENGKGALACGLTSEYGLGSTEFHVLRARNPELRAFIAQWLTFGRLRLAAAAQMSGSAGQRRVPSNFFDRYRIPDLPLSEQRRIAEILNATDDQIRLTEMVISKLELVGLGVLDDLLHCGVDKFGRVRQPGTFEMQTSIAGTYPANWNLVRLDQIAEVDRGKFGHRPRNDPAYLNGPFPFIQTGDVAAARGGSIVEASQSLSPLGSAVSREFPEGTIAVTIAANIADTAILGRPMCFPDSVVGVFVRRPNVAQYVEFALRLAKPRLEARAPQSAQRNINLQDLRPLIVPLPDPAEQEGICRVMAAHARSISRERAALTKLHLTKAGLAADLLTGLVRVHVEAAS
jgi:type I restriction enzyme S subunit